MENPRRLIELVRTYPELYKTELRAAPYKRVSLTDSRVKEIWKTIAAKLNMESAEYAAARWSELARQYHRAKNAKKDNFWPHLEEMRFLDAASTQSHRVRSEIVQQHFKEPALAVATSTSMGFSSPATAEEPVEVVMVEPTAPTDPSAIPTPHVVKMDRIETLFNSLDEANKAKAEKRVVTYLCLCQIKSLNNESVDDIVI